LDPAEIDCALVARKLTDLYNNKNRYTHMEIYKDGILGVAAGHIPFANHNQLPRLSFQVFFSISLL